VWLFCATLRRPQPERRRFQRSRDTAARFRPHQWQFLESSSIATHGKEKKFENINIFVDNGWSKSLTDILQYLSWLPEFRSTAGTQKTRLKKIPKIMLIDLDIKDLLTLTFRNNTHDEQMRSNYDKHCIELPAKLSSNRPRACSRASSRARAEPGSRFESHFKKALRNQPCCSTRWKCRTFSLLPHLTNSCECFGRIKKNSKKKQLSSQQAHHQSIRSNWK